MGVHGADEAGRHDAVLDLNSGSRLTHGAAFNFSGKLYKVVHGLTRDTETIDYAQVRALAQEHKPKVLVVKAQRLTHFTIKLRGFVRSPTGPARPCSWTWRIAGLVAAEVHPSPVPASRTSSPPPRTRRCAVARRHVDEGRRPTRAINSQIFWHPGGPLMHVIAGKAVAFRGR